MKPAPFRYVAVRSEDELGELLAEHGDDAQILAGGQSIVPMMNFRVVTPEVVLDINGLEDLGGIALEDGELSIGALTRHAAIEDSVLVAERCPLLSSAVRHVAHRAVRNRGTIGGSVALAYPGAELPLALAVLGAEIRLGSRSRGRSMPLRDFILGGLETARGSDEYVRGFRIELPPEGSAAFFVETSRRHGDFAIAAAAAIAEYGEGGRLQYLRAGVSGGTGVPVRLETFEQAVLDAGAGGAPLKEASRGAIAAIEVFGDPHYPEDYRRHVLAGMLEQAVAGAIRKAGQRHGG